MKLRNKLPAVIFWIVAVSSILFGVLALASALGYVRFAVISDGSAAPLAFKGSLEIAQQVPTSSIKEGDVILVGSHDAGGSTLGQIIHVDKADNGSAIVTLKAPAFETPDEWNYELSGITHKHLLSVPFLGDPLNKISDSPFPTLLIGFLSLLFLAMVVALRIYGFKSNDKDTDPWFKKLEPFSKENQITVLSDLFEEKGYPLPPTYSKKRWWHRMKKEIPTQAQSLMKIIDSAPPAAVEQEEKTHVNN